MQEHHTVASCTTIDASQQANACHRQPPSKRENRAPSWPLSSQIMLQASHYHRKSTTTQATAPHHHFTIL